MPIQPSCDLPPTTVVVESDIGMFTIDLAEVESAKQAAALGAMMPDKRSPFAIIVEEFLGDLYLSNSRYWSPSLGQLIKSFSGDHFADNDWAVVEEFNLEKDRRVNAQYQVRKIPGEADRSYLHTGIQLMQHVDGKRMVVTYITDQDGDERMSVHYCEIGDEHPFLLNEDKNMFGYQIIENLEDDFFRRGPLKGRFFDLDYNFIEKDRGVEGLIAWNDEVKRELKRNVLDFHKAMPKLQSLGLSSSRGIILAGPPGTGKTMIGKWLASSTGMTSILVSAEKIRNRGNIESVYKRARKLSPTLIIVEDIDTVGGLDRRVSDHPLLGEFLQCMDGMVSNAGVITLATTNHSGSMDPAMADRPGRFDRVIEVQLPGRDQRKRILERKLDGMTQHASITKEVIESLANRSKGLSGAWIVEIAQFAQVLAFARDEEALTSEDLESSLDDVLARRGLAYRIDSMPGKAPADEQIGLGSLWG